MSALDVAEAAEAIRRGALVGFPTETVWGLAADPRNAGAVARLRRWKGRDAEQPISVMIESFAALSKLGAKPTPLAERLAQRFWPGPLTLVVRCAEAFAPGIAGPDGAVGFRCSSHSVAQALVHAAGPITATSLNRSGEPACSTRAQAERCAGVEISLVAGIDARREAPSTVVDVTGEEPRVLRPGAISERAVAAALRGDPRG